MTVNEVIFAIREKLKEYVDDTRFTDTYLVKLVDLKRALLIRQQYNQIQRSVDNQLEQLLVLPLEEVDSSDTPEEQTEFITRSKVRIPKVIELHHRNLIQRIATVGKLDKPINVVSMRRFIYIGQDEFEVDSTYAAIDEQGYIYIKSLKNEEVNYNNISIRAIFESPLNLAKEGDTLDTFEYPANIHMIDTIINMIVQELANIKSLPTDNENNSSDDATILSNVRQNG